MRPIKFEGVNVVYAEEQPEYQPLPANKAKNGSIITCWELTDAEVEQLCITKKLWINMLTFNKPLQPILPSVIELTHPSFEDLKFATPQEIFDDPEYGSKCLEAYEFMKKCLTDEGHEELFWMATEIVKKHGAEKAWSNFEFETKLPEHAPTFKMAFEYIEYATARGINITQTDT